MGRQAALSNWDLSLVRSQVPQSPVVPSVAPRGVHSRTSTTHPTRMVERNSLRGASRDGHLGSNIAANRRMHRLGTAPRTARRRMLRIYYAAPPSSSQPSIGAASVESTVHSPPTSRRRAFPQFGQRRSVASRSGSPGPLIADSTRAPQFGQVSCSLSCSCVVTAGLQNVTPASWSLNVGNVKGRMSHHVYRRPPASSSRSSIRR